MPTFGEAIKEATRLGLCSVFALNEGVNALLSPVFGNSLGLYPASSALRRKLCSDDPANDPVYVPPFQGGQCPEKYIVSFSTDVGGPNPSTGSILVRGPIGGLIEEDGPSGSKRVFILASSDPVFGGQCFNNAPNTGPGQWLLATYTPTNGSKSQINSVTPCGDDSCGDPPPVIGPPGPINYPTDITYNIDGDTTITVPVNFTFAPAYVDLDLDVKIPVRLNVDGLEFNGTVEFTPEFTFNFGPRGVQPGPGVPDDDDDGGGGNPGVPVPEDEEDFSPIVGVLVFSTIVSDANNATGFPSVDGPTFLVPRLGSVQFAVKTGNSIGWTSDLDVKNLECYIPCPAPQGAIAVRVTPIAGVTRTFTPVRGKPLTSFD